MSVQQFCLRWNNHQPNFISVFSTLLHNESLVDVTLAAEGRHLQAHKVVLSACSSYFQTLFTVNPCQHPIVILKDVKYMDLKIMVDFMYYGEVNVSQEQLPHILKTAEMLKIKGLAEMPDSTSLTKSHSASSERADILTPGESTWGSDTHRHSPSPAPMSPNSRRKRLRKSSTGSTSVSTERATSEDQVVMHSSSTGEVSTNAGLVRSLKHNTSSESDNQPGVDGSQEIHEENRLITQKSTESDSGVSVVQNLGAPMVDITGPSVSGNCSQAQPAGLQWTLVEHGYPRFALSQCQTSLDGNGPGTSMQYTGVSGAGTYTSSQVISVNSCAVSTDNYQTVMSNSTSPSITESIPPYNQSGQESSCNMNQSSAPPAKAKRTKNPQADENFVRALEAVRFGGIGFCKAARMYGVNNRTLWLEFKKRGYPNNRPSIKSRVKLETPSPPPPGNSAAPPQQPESVPPEEIYHGGSNSGDSPGGLPVMCPPPTHGHSMGGMMGFLDTRHVEFSPAMARPRFQEPIGMSQAPINLHGVGYSNM